MQLVAVEAAASNIDFNAWAGVFGSAGAGSVGGYTNTPERKVFAAAFADAYNRLVLAVRTLRSKKSKADSESAAHPERTVVRLALLKR